MARLSTQSGTVAAPSMAGLCHKARHNFLLGIKLVPPLSRAIMAEWPFWLVSLPDLHRMSSVFSNRHPGALSFMWRFGALGGTT
jgi:hypothetical protein